MKTKQIIKLKDFGITKKTGILKDGTRLSVFNRPFSPINIKFAFFCGARFDPVGKEGLAHFMEHMVVAGTKKYPSKKNLAEYIENYGGIFGARTGNEIMSINIEVAENKDFKAAIHIANEMINKSLFQDKVIRSERNSIHKEIDDWKSAPTRYVWEVWRKTFFQETEMGRPILGDHKILDKIKKKELKSFYKEHLTSGKLAIIASGDIKYSEAKNVIDNNLEIKKTRRVTLGNKLPNFRNEPVIIEDVNYQNQIHFILGYRTTSEFDEEQVVLRVISTILGGGRASILTNRLRYENGLVYDVYASNNCLSDTGTFIVKSSTNSKDINKTFEIIFDEFNKTKKKGFTNNQINFAKNKISKSLKRNTQTSQSWVDFHTLGEMFDAENSLTLDKYVNKLLEVDNSMIIKTARRYFGEGKWYLSAVGGLDKEILKNITNN